MTHDVIVCGAGPAGGVAARRLAAAGMRVALVGTAARPGWEGLSARSRALLAEEGLHDGSDVISGPFARRGVWGDGRQVDGIEWLAERSQLAEALCAAAKSAGVDHCRDTVTDTKRLDGCWRVSLRSGEVLAAPTLIDARGRRGRQRRGPLLLAIGQRLRRARRTGAPNVPDARGTGIGVADFGWCWWAECGQTLWVQVIGRPRTGHPAPWVNGPRTTPPRTTVPWTTAAWISAAAAQIPALARALTGASICGDAVARPAHARIGVLGENPTLWRVGDCALALDPLSGQGIYEALRSARLVAAAIQSVGNGGDALPAHRFVAQRYEEAWLSGLRSALEFYRENDGRGDFWRDTAEAYAALLPARAAGATATATHRLQQAGVMLQPQLSVSSGG